MFVVVTEAKGKASKYKLSFLYPEKSLQNRYILYALERKRNLRSTSRLIYSSKHAEEIGDGTIYNVHL